MRKLRTHSLRLKNKVLVIGFDQQGQNVYSAFMTQAKYEQAKLPWNNPERMKILALKTVRGYIFDEDGMLNQEFESNFSLKTGQFEQGWSRDDEGIVDEY